MKSRTWRVRGAAAWRPGGTGSRQPARRRPGTRRLGLEVLESRRPLSAWHSAADAGGEGGGELMVFVPDDLAALPGGSVVVPVKAQVTASAGVTLSGFDVVLEFDPAKFAVASSQLGSLLAAPASDLEGSWSTPSPGTLIYTADAQDGSVLFPQGTLGDLFTVVLNVAEGAAAGPSPVNLRASYGTTVTAVFAGDPDWDDVVVAPLPTDAASDDVDGLVTINTPPLTVANLTPTASGFTARFSGPVEPSVLNLVDSASGSLGPADVTLVGARTGPVRGSLTLDGANRDLTFVGTGGVLPADTYTVTLRSAASGFREPGGGLLDGNADGVTGDDYQSAFTVAELPAGTVTVSLPDFARGAGQAVNIPNAKPGLPIRVSDAAGITSLAVDLVYGGDLLEITAAAPAAGLPADWTVENPPDLSTPGVARIRAAGTTPLAGANVEVVRLTAAVPAAAPYGGSQVLRLENISINDGGIAAVGDAAVHKAAYLGDTDGSGIHSAADAFLVVQVALGLANGFSAHAWTDPRIVGDADGSGVLSASDAFLIVQEGLGLAEPFVPDNPDLQVTPVGGGVDPQFRIGGSPSAVPGGAAVVPIELAVEAAATNVASFEFYVSFDSTKLSLDVATGVRPGAQTPAPQWRLLADQVAPGQVRVLGFPSGGQALAAGAVSEVARLVFRVDAAAAGGPTRLDLEPHDAFAGGYLWTALDEDLCIQ